MIIMMLTKTNYIFSYSMIITSDSNGFVPGTTRGEPTDEVLEALGVEPNPQEAGSFLVILPRGCPAGQRVRAVLPSTG